MKKRLFISTIIIICILSALFIPSKYKSDVKIKYQHKEISKINMKDTGFRNGELVTHLPIFLIHSNINEIPGNLKDNQRKLSCQYSVIDNKGILNKSSDKPKEEGNMYISIRGRSSRYYPKKQYSIHTVNDSFENKNVEIFNDFPPESNWILNGSWSDHSMIRNYMVYTISGEIMDYVPKAKLCEVMSIAPNGKKDYQGVYTMIEKIKVSENRLNLTPYNNKYKESSYILQVNDYVDNKKIDNIYSNKYDLEYPNINELTPKTEKYIKNDICTIEKTLNDAIYTQNWNSVEELIDLDSFADYFIINEFFQNYDATYLSTYLYKDLGGKLYIGPVWDFDGAFNNFIDKSIPYDTFKLNNSFFYFYLFKNPEFVQLVQYKYKKLRKNILSEKYLLKFIDDCDIYLKYPAKRNSKLWYENNINLYNDDLVKMREFIINRGKWMDKHIDDLDIARMII